MQGASITNGRSSAACAGVPLFHAAWLFAGGIAVSGMIWVGPGALLISLIILACVCAVSALRAQRVAWLPLALLWMLLGAWCAEMEPHPAPAPQLMALSDGLLRTVEATVVNAGPVRSESDGDADSATASEVSTQSIDVVLRSIEVVDDSADRQVPIDGTVRLNVRWKQGQQVVALGCGERIRATVRLLPPQRYRDPGVFDRAEYLLAQGITTTGSLDAAQVQSVSAARDRSLRCWLSGAQQAAAARLLALPGSMHAVPAALRIDHDDAVMLAAMVTGDRTFLSHSLRVGFERTGSFHMLVVSGLHLAIVSGFLMMLARRLRIPRVPATLLTIAASFAYALFTGFATPVQRSLWMVSLYLIGRLIYRERSALNSIGFASLCLLVISPRSLFDSSFQMTLLAVVSIAGVAVPLLGATVHPYTNALRDLRLVAIDVKVEPRLAQFRIVMRMFAFRLRGVFGRRIGWTVFPWAVRFTLQCAEALVVTAIVECAMSLPMAMYFHRLTLFALPVNLLILPLLVVLMPAALLTLFIALISPAVAVVPGVLTAFLLHIGVWLVRLFGSARWGDLRIAAPSVGQIAAFCVILAGSILLVRGSRRWQRGAAVAALAAAAVIAAAPRAIQHPRDALLMEAIDVGQGDSLLLITPEGKTMLVDGGGFGGGPRRATSEFDIGEQVVSPALWARGIRHLDVVALSHAHSDHMGGLPAVLHNFHPGELWVGVNPPGPDYDALLAQAGAQHTRVRTFHAGDAAMLGSVQVRALAPAANYLPGREASNNDSLVLRAAFRGTSVLLEGDAQAPVERDIESDPQIQSTLLKVGHHGSASSSRPEFLERVSPQWAVISCGLHNRYGHPRAEVLEELQAAHVRTYSTDVNGAVCFRLDGVSAAALASCSTDAIR